MVLNISRAALVAATLSLSAPLLPAVAQETTQSTETAPFVFEISVPNIVALDSSMSEDQLKALFSASFLDHADALALLHRIPGAHRKGGQYAGDAGEDFGLVAGGDLRTNCLHIRDLLGDESHHVACGQCRRRLVLLRLTAARR